MENKLSVVYAQSAAVVLLAALFLFSPFLDFRLWGIDFLRFATVVHFVILVPILAGLVFILIRKMPQQTESIGAAPWMRINTPWLLVYTVAIAVVAYLMRPDYPFLGDGLLRAGEIEGGIVISKTEPLSTLIHAGVYNVLNLIATVRAVDVYSAVSSLAGAIFVSSLFFGWSLKEGKFDARKLTISLMIVSFGTTALLFGWVESYTVSFVLAAGSVICAHEYLREGRLLIPALLLGILATAAHLANTTILPGLLYMAFLAWRREKGGSTKMAIALSVLALISVPVYFTFVFSGYGVSRSLSLEHLFVSLDPDSYYSLFSIDHVLDVINEFVLVLPAVIALVPAIFMDREWTDAKRSTRTFSLAVIVPAFLLMALFDPKLGYARDWDLFAMPAGLIGISIVMLAPNKSLIASLPVRAAICLGLIITCSFLLTNRISSSNVKRFDYLLSLDPERSPFGREMLFMYFMNNGDAVSAERQLRIGLEIDQNKRHYKLLSEMMYAFGDYDRAGKEAFRSIRLDDNYDEGHFHLARALEATGDTSIAVHHYFRAVELKPDNARYRNSYGSILVDRGEYVEAERQLARAVSLDPGNATYVNNLGTAMLGLNKVPEARQCFERALRISPSFHLAMFNLARVADAMGEKTLARDYFYRIIEEAPGTELARQVQVLLDTLE